MELVIAEKPSVAQSIAAVLGATQRKDGYLEGNEYLVSWCVGHLVELAQPESYEEAWKKWSYESLPIIPQEWQHEVKSDTKAQYQILKKLMHDDRVVCNRCRKGGRIDFPPDLQHGRVQKTDEAVMDFFHGGERYP